MCSLAEDARMHRGCPDIIGAWHIHTILLKTGAESSGSKHSSGRAESRLHRSRSVAGVVFALPEEILEFSQLDQGLAGVDQLGCEL